MMKKLIAMLLIAVLTLTCAALGEAPAVPQEIVDRFSDTWVAEGFSAEIWYEENTFKCDMALSDDSFCEYRNCNYDDATDTLVCKDGVRFFATYDEETLDYLRDEISSGLTAVFTEKDNLLACEDSEGLLKDVVFLRLYDAEDIDAAGEADHGPISD